MKILLIGNYYYPEHLGGVETVSFNLVKHYRQAGHEVRWIASDVPPRLRTASHGDVPIRAWNFAEERLGFPYPLPSPAALPKIYSSIRWSDVVHLQDCLYLMNIMAFVLAKAMKRPVLITQYAKIIPYAQPYKRWLQRIAYATVGRLMFAAASKLVFITANVRDAMGHVYPARSYGVVPLGVDTDFYAPVSENRRRAVRQEFIPDSNRPFLLFVGRMVERKGLHLIRGLVEKHPEWHWVLVGRPDDFLPSEWRCDNLSYFSNLPDNRLRELYAAADVVVHPSKGEGITLVVSESMASGTPVIISMESLYEVPPEERGLFFAVSLEADSIEAAVLRLTSMNFMEREALRSGCRKFAESRWSWKSVADQYLDLLKQLSG